MLFIYELIQIDISLNKTIIPVISVYKYLIPKIVRKMLTEMKNKSK